MNRKPLKIIGRKVQAEPIEVSTQQPVQGRRGMTGRIKKPCLRLQKAVDLIIDQGMPESRAMREAGYSDSSAHQLSIKQSTYYQERMESHVRQLIEHRDEVLAEMRKSYMNAPYAAQSMTVASINSQLVQLTGKKNGAGEFELPDEEKKTIINIININAK